MIGVRGTNRELFASIRLPASKSISNRLLVLQFFNGPGLVVKNLSGADDTVLLSSLLELVRQYHKTGSEGILRLDTRNAGTAMRFLAALLSARRGQYLLTGSERMKQRPIGDLVDALLQIGADIQYIEKQGYPPLLIKGRHLAGGTVEVNPAVSSQFLSALMLIAPFLEDGLLIEIKGKPSSWPYVMMTSRLLLGLGAKVTEVPAGIKITGGKAITREVIVEADWSSAAFWYSLLAMAPGGEISLEGLHFTGMQGDEQAAAFFNELGVMTIDISHGVKLVKSEILSREFRADFSPCPDLALPVIVTCAGLGMKASFYGLDNLRIKESDRLEALSRELLKTGVSLLEKDRAWHLEGTMQARTPLRVDDSSDHRVAMAFACLAARGLDVQFQDPEVVNKSYPGFWDDLQSAGIDCYY